MTTLTLKKSFFLPTLRMPSTAGSSLCGADRQRGGRGWVIIQIQYVPVVISEEVECM